MSQTAALAQPSLPGIIQSVTGIVSVIGIAIGAVAGIFQIRKLQQEGRNANKKLEVIHTLVNSTLTASIESDLAATRHYLTTMEKLTDELKNTGQAVPPETAAAMAEAHAKIDSRTQQIADRLVSAEHLLAEEKRGDGALPAVRT